MTRRPIEKDLRGSEPRYQLLVELSPAAIIVQSAEQIVFVNSAGLTLFGGRQPEDLMGSSLWDFVSSDGRKLIDWCRQTQNEGELAPRTQLEFTRLNKSRFFAEVAATSMVFKGKPAIQFILRDNTAQKQFENQLRQRNKELAARSAIAATVSLSKDLNQILRRALDEVLRLKIVPGEMFGMIFLLEKSEQRLRLAAARGTPPDHPCLKSAPAIGECLCGLAAQRGELIASNNALTDGRHTRRWQGMDPHQDICVPLKARGNVVGVMVIRLPEPSVIAEENLRLLQAVADQIGVAAENAQLRELHERAVIEERERIARELHDGFSQLLGYVNTKAMAVRFLLKNGQLEAADRNLVQLEEAARGLLVDVRETILDLRTVGRNSAGLAANLQEIVAHFTELSGLPVTLTIGSQVARLTITPETEYQLIHIVQEALNNAHKHAFPTRTWVSTDVRKGRLELIIGDDGVGFAIEAESGAHPSHFGLRSMRERAATVGADLGITSSVGQGTCVSLCLPLEEG